MAHRALALVSRGLLPPVAVGELIPDTYVDSLGDEQPVDFDRLVGLGAAEPVTAKKRRAEPDAETTLDAPPDEA